MQSKFYDGMMKISVQDTIVKISFVNLSEGQDGKRQISNADEVVLTLVSFNQMCDSINELREKIENKKQTETAELIAEPVEEAKESKGE